MTLHKGALRIGSRPSPLALTQAKMVQKELQHKMPTLTTEIVPISTEGDLDTQTPLWEMGGKGVFIKALEVALLTDKIDIAVHSLKDVTAQIHDDLHLAGFLKPEATGDVLILKAGQTLNDLANGAKIGTSSMRRKALLKHLYPQLIPVDIRGNVQTRMDKIGQDLDGVILSEAGLIRLNLSERISHHFDPQQFIPAPGQGVIAIECSKQNEAITSLCKTISDPEQSRISHAELQFLGEVGFDCRDPLGTLSWVEGDEVVMKVFQANTDLSEPRVFTRRVLNPV